MQGLVNKNKSKGVNWMKDEKLALRAQKSAKERPSGCSITLIQTSARH